jgi:hypothetical protein
MKAISSIRAATPKTIAWATSDHVTEVGTHEHATTVSVTAARDNVVSEYKITTRNSAVVASAKADESSEEEVVLANQTTHGAKPNAKMATIT